MARTKKNDDTKPQWTGVNPSNITEIRECLNQTDTIMTEMEDVRENMKECFMALNEKYGMPKRLFNMLVKMHYKNNGDEELEKNDELSEAWNRLVAGND